MNEEQRRGEEAKRILAEPLVVEAFAEVEAAILANLRIVDVGAMDAMRDWVVSLQLLGKVKQHIEQVMVTGELSALANSDQKTRIA